MTLLSHALSDGPDPEPKPAGDPPRVTDTTPDGWVFDVDTGEVVGHHAAEGFVAVVTREDAERVLDLRAAVEADLLALDARRAAVNLNFETQRRALVRRLAWWEWRFAGPLLAWARQQLRGGRSRTLTLDRGRIRARKTPASHRVIDEAAALAFVKFWRPELVVVRESVGIKAVLEAQREAERASGGEAVLPFLIAAPPGESWTIETCLTAPAPTPKGLVDDDDGGSEN